MATSPCPACSWPGRALRPVPPPRRDQAPGPRACRAIPPAASSRQATGWSTPTRFYNAREAVATTPSVWRDGTQVFAAPADTIEAGPKPALPLKVGGGIRLGAGLTPGDYVLQLAATSKDPKGRAKTVVRRTDFQVH